MPAANFAVSIIRIGEPVNEAELRAAIDEYFKPNPKSLMGVMVYELSNEQIHLLLDPVGQEPG